MGKVSKSEAENQGIPDSQTNGSGVLERMRTSIPLAVVLTLLFGAVTSTLWVTQMAHSASLKQFFVENTYQLNTNTTRLNSHEEYIMRFLETDSVLSSQIAQQTAKLEAISESISEIKDELIYIRQQNGPAP
jgi:septal ring factor EnvC (AmiA/AmiB activator)